MEGQKVLTEIAIAGGTVTLGECSRSERGVEINLKVSGLEESLVQKAIKVIGEARGVTKTSLTHAKGGLRIITVLTPAPVRDSGHRPHAATTQTVADRLLRVIERNLTSASPEKRSTELPPIRSDDRRSRTFRKPRRRR